MAAVRSLGYAIVSATDLDAWKEFAADLLGLQVVEHTADRLLLRMDEKAYRLDVRRSDTDEVSVLGWEVAGPKELEELATALERAGYAVKRQGADAVRDRLVSGLVAFDDPSGQRLELYYGLKNDRSRFVSPTGATFVTGTGGLGHAFQFVHDDDAYSALYLDILGFRISDYIDFGPGAYGTFTHVNPRHHSFAWAPVPDMPTGVAHLMFETDDIDLVGRAWDRVQDGAAPVAATFGKHSNDEMLSFYVVSPSGFQIEYGYGGKLVDETWTPSRFDVASFWGHRKSDPDEPDV